ncbi:MAG: hypothetical protein AAB296_08255, partial [Candidatus Desantisbacteria bacterium]
PNGHIQPQNTRPSISVSTIRTIAGIRKMPDIRDIAFKKKNGESIGNMAANFPNDNGYVV